MLWKTHLAIGLAAALYFSMHVNYPMLFIAITIASGFFPDIDSRFSYLGKNLVARPLQMATDHRGIIHSYTLCILLSFGIALLLPTVALPFFLGYSFHLLGDSFTPQGIRAFWPLKGISKGMIRTGGKIEKAIFYTFVIIDVVLIGTIIYLTA